MSFNTNRQARILRQELGPPPQYTHGPWQWAYVAAVHTASTTTLSASAAAGSATIETVASVEANALVVVNGEGPLQIGSVSGSGPYTLTFANQTLPVDQTSGATVNVLPTVDLYLDGWQNAPDNLPPGTSQTLTVGVRRSYDYAPQVGHIVLVARGTGLQRSDRVVIGPLAPAADPAGRVVASTSYTLTAGSWVVVGNMAASASYLYGGMTYGASALTVPVAGVYSVTASLRSATVATGSLGVGIWHNGSLYSGNNAFYGNPSTGGGVSITYADDVPCSAGDTLGLAGYCSVAMATDGGIPTFTHFAAHLAVPL